MIFTKDNLGFLYGEAEVKYGKIGIKGEFITADLDSNTISSTYGLDSVGKEFGYPVFDDNGTQYEMKKVRYNFQTRKAFINQVVTQQGEGYIVAKDAKMNSDNSFYMRNAKYTTCDLHDHPHFYLNLSKAKVRPGKDVVTGPAWLVWRMCRFFRLFFPLHFSRLPKPILQESSCPVMEMK
jgi:lipopolysaccharide assembly outer membrane protein LptD (OstA)